MRHEQPETRTPQLVGVMLPGRAMVVVDGRTAEMIADLLDHHVEIGALRGGRISFDVGPTAYVFELLVRYRRKQVGRDEGAEQLAAQPLGD